MYQPTPRLSKHNAADFLTTVDYIKELRRRRVRMQQPNLQRQSALCKQRICTNHRRTQSAAAPNPRQSTTAWLKVPLVHPDAVLQLRPRPARLRHQKLHSRHDQRLCRTKRRRVPMPKLLRKPRQHPHGTLAKNLE
jgi:hypothetical protein